MISIFESISNLIKLKILPLPFVFLTDVLFTDLCGALLPTAINNKY